MQTAKQSKSSVQTAGKLDFFFLKSGLLRQTVRTINCKWSNQICVSRHNQLICMVCFDYNACIFRQELRLLQCWSTNVYVSRIWNCPLIGQRPPVYVPGFGIKMDCQVSSLGFICNCRHTHIYKCSHRFCSEEESRFHQDSIHALHLFRKKSN